MKRAKILGAWVGVESVTRRAEGGAQGFQRRRRRARGAAPRISTHGIHVLGSFIFGLRRDTPTIFDATVDLADRADLNVSRRDVGRVVCPHMHCCWNKARRT
jgi:hypothetical protein